MGGQQGTLIMSQFHLVGFLGRITLFYSLRSFSHIMSSNIFLIALGFRSTEGLAEHLTPQKTSRGISRPDSAYRTGFITLTIATSLTFALCSFTAWAEGEEVKASTSLMGYKSSNIHIFMPGPSNQKEVGT